MDNFIENKIQNSQNVQEALSNNIIETVNGYFSKMGDQPIMNLYDMLLNEIEGPLLKTVMEQTRGNQSKAAILLGISRGTLRKKLKTQDLI